MSTRIQLHRPLAACALALAALCLGALLAPGSAAAQSVHTTATEHRKAERIKTLPISRSAWGEARSIVSLSPNAVGRIADGDRVEGYADVEFTICQKSTGGHRGMPCIGRMYGFNPNIKMRIVLAPSKGAASPGNTATISPIRSLTCVQKQPNRNRHCTAQIPWSAINVPQAAKLPCQPGSCHMNIVATAFHRKAKPNQKVVLGSSDDKKRISQGRAKLSSVVLRPAGQRPQRVERIGRKARGKIPVARKGGNRNKVVAVSVPVHDLRAGDQLVVDARAMARIGHLPYNVFTRSTLMLADSRWATEPRKAGRAGKVADSTVRIGADNGFNCTQGNSAHRDPCEIRKGGILGVREGSAKPLYINLIVGMSAQGTRPQYSRWRKGHAAKLLSSGNFIEVRRYRGTSSCADCHVSGPTGGRFGPDKQAKGKPRKLVAQLKRFGITQGTLACKRRRGRPLQCRWSSQGRIGNSRLYSCSNVKAVWKAKKKRWNTKICKDALGAELWGLLRQRGVIPLTMAPTFTGACDEKHEPRRFICKWFAEGRADGMKLFCKGLGHYDFGRDRWAISGCKIQSAPLG
jgi:hypothetical protein